MLQALQASARCELWQSGGRNCSSKLSSGKKNIELQLSNISHQFAMCIYIYVYMHTYHTHPVLANPPSVSGACRWVFVSHETSPRPRPSSRSSRALVPGPMSLEKVPTEKTRLGRQRHGPGGASGEGFSDVSGLSSTLGLHPGEITQNDSEGTKWGSTGVMPLRNKGKSCQLPPPSTRCYVCPLCSAHHVPTRSADPAGRPCRHGRRAASPESERSLSDHVLTRFL